MSLLPPMDKDQGQISLPSGGKNLIAGRIAATVRRVATHSLPQESPRGTAIGVPVRRAMVLLIALFALAWFGSLEMRGLFLPDEGRYAEIPREMLASGDWITPRLNDLKYFAKPPLQYWLTAISFALFGEDEWTARLPSATLGFGCLLLVGYTASRIRGPIAGLFAGAMLGSSWAFYLGGQFLTLDMAVSAWLTVVLCSFLLAQQADDLHGRRRWMLAAWVGIACAVLTKGLIGVLLPLLTLVVYSVVARDTLVWKRLCLSSGLMLSGAIVLPWFLTVQFRHPEFFDIFFVQEHVRRYLDTSAGRPGAWWYYVPVLLFGMAPWTPWVVFRVAEHLAGPRDNQPVSPRARTDLFCLTWVVIIVLFFCLSRSKLPAYVLPAFPAIAIWASGLPGANRLRVLGACAMYAILLGTLLVVAVYWLPHWPKASILLTPETFDLIEPYGTAATLLASGMLAYWCTTRMWPLRAFATLCAGSFLFWLCLAGFFYAKDDHFSSERLVEGFAGKERPFQPHASVFSVGQFDPSLPFYLGRTVTLVATAGELKSGIDAEPHKVISALDAFENYWRRADAQAFAIVTPAQYAQFAAAHLPMTKLASDSRLVLVSRLPYTTTPPN
jgi:4-amino-4-deoxy-L-arabinose transferase-like glycosyltransferase